MTPPATPAEVQPALQTPQAPAEAVSPVTTGEPAPAPESPAGTATPPTEPPPGPAPDAAVAEVRLLLDGKPYAVSAAQAPVFWFRNEGTKVVEKPRVEYADGAFRVHGLRPGRYGVSVRVDLDPSNPNLYPGDLSAWSAATLEGGRPAVVDLTLRKLMRLRQPVDNASPIPGWDVPCGAGNVVPPQVLLAWEPVDPAATYDVRIERLLCGRGYASAGSAFSRSTTDTWVKAELPPSGEGECYSLRLTAQKEGRTVGILATHGTSGLGWEYRFRVAP
jgi:hypothetical protein